jgi:hypothetical protein
VHGFLGGDLVVKELLYQPLGIVDDGIRSIRDRDTPMPLPEVFAQCIATTPRPIATWLRAIQRAGKVVEYMAFQVLTSIVRLVAI